jgi:molybdenum cofactor synthesis domain-containing protein
MQIQVGIITISDRASAGDYDDLGGPALKQVAQKIGWHVLAEAIVPDEIARIQETIRSFAMQGCGLILSTGGTGIGHDASRIARIRRSDARRINEDYAERHSLAQPCRGRRSGSGDRVTREAERRCGMSQLCARRNPAWRRGSAMYADVVLKLSARINSARSAGASPARHSS